MPQQQQVLHDASTKTVFVLDHTQYFGISSETLIDLDFGKNKGNSLPLPPISKSLWTCAVESSVEYCRIVWDLFPTGKLIRFVVSDSNAHIVNTWNPNTQTMQHVMNAMSLVSIPPRISPQSNDYSVIHGLRAAAEALAEPTDDQLHQQQATSTANNAPSSMINAGRVICITSARDNASMKSLEDIFMTLVVQQNQMTAGRAAARAADVGRSTPAGSDAAASDPPLLLNIDRCHFVIINVYPTRVESMVSDRAPDDLSTVLQTEIHSVRAGDLPFKMTHLILPHYDLASTTVTGIPMKEEQNASSSANYDVEIFHSRHAHSVIQGNELVLPTSRKEGHHYETVTLKWCTPRGFGASEMQPCVAQHRVTPVDVTSRPSSCLINFLLNGRSVLLEMPRKAGGKLTSHLLSAHGGEIFIHTLHVSRSCLEDPPSILEGCGGRVTDYRITDFAAFMQSMRLQPLRPVVPAAATASAAEGATSAAASLSGSEPHRRQPDETLRRVRQRLHSRTPYWPVTLGTTVLYNVRQFVEPLLAIIARDQLTADDVLQCRQVVFNLVARETRQETLPLPLGGAHRLKNSKKEEQYRLLWAELETLLSAGPNSAEHRAVLQYVRECYRSSHPKAALTGVDGGKIMDGTDRGDGGGITTAARRNILVHKTTTDSPWSPPLAKVAATGVRGKSLLEIFTAAERERSQKRVDFAGRLCTPLGQVAKLYPNLGLKDVNARSTENEAK